MKNSARYILAAITGFILPVAFWACNDDMTNGSTIVDDEVAVYIDSLFSVRAQTVENKEIISRTILGLIGDIDDPVYGHFHSDIVAQFMPSLNLDTAGVTVEMIDSVKLQMRYEMDGFVGDSLAPMGVKVYPLTKQLPEPIYSSFVPEGYYDPNTLLGQKVYSATRKNLSEEDLELQYNYFEVTLPTSLGRRFFTEYTERPQTFSSPEAFAQFFPGLYVESAYGSGRVTRVARTSINIHYHTVTKASDGTDSIIPKTGVYFAVTPEVVCNNNMTYAMGDDLKQRFAAGQKLLVSPVGFDVEIKMPAREILSRYRAQVGSGLGVLNSLSMKIPVEEIENSSSIAPPPNVLLIKKSEKDDFISKGDVPDNTTSFYASYDSKNKCYSFPYLRSFIETMAEKDEITDDDETFVIMPVLVSTETASDGTVYVTSITPYVTVPTMCRLLTEDIDIRLVFSRQTISY